MAVSAVRLSTISTGSCTPPSLCCCITGGGTLAKASLLGANTVKGPGPASVELSAAAPRRSRRLLAPREAHSVTQAQGGMLWQNAESHAVTRDQHGTGLQQRNAPPDYGTRFGDPGLTLHLQPPSPRVCCRHEPAPATTPPAHPSSSSSDCGGYGKASDYIAGSVTLSGEGLHVTGFMRARDGGIEPLTGGRMPMEPGSSTGLQTGSNQSGQVGQIVSIQPPHYSVFFFSFLFN